MCQKTDFAMKHIAKKGPRKILHFVMHPPSWQKMANVSMQNASTKTRIIPNNQSS
jgi:hypothetical protein